MLDPNWGMFFPWGDEIPEEDDGGYEEGDFLTDAEAVADQLSDINITLVAVSFNLERIARALEAKNERA